MEYVKLWLITLLILHNLIIRTEQEAHIPPRNWSNEDEFGEVTEEYLQEEEEEEEEADNNQAQQEEYNYDEAEGANADARTPGQRFRCQLLRILKQRGMVKE